MSHSKSLTLEALDPGNELQSLHSCLSILNFPWSCESALMGDICEETRALCPIPIRDLPVTPGTPCIYLSRFYNVPGSALGNFYPCCHPSRETGPGRLGGPTDYTVTVGV